MIKEAKSLLPKVLSAVLATTLVFTSGAFGSLRIARAAVIKSTTISGNKIYYTQDADGVHICSDKGSGTAGTATYKANIKNDVSIPAKIGNYAVTSIEPNAFSGCTKLTSVTLNRATSLASIGNYAFNGCTKLLTVDTTGVAGAGYVVIRGDLSKIRTIGNYVFHKCKSLTAVDIANVTLGTKAFYGCEGVSKVTLSSTQVGTSAFEGCSAISQVSLSGSTRLQTSAFAGIGSAKVNNNTTQDIGSSDYFGSSIWKVMLYGKFVLNPDGGTLKDADGKTVTTLVTDYYLKGAAAELPKPVKTNYTFSGWYCNGKKITAGVGYRATLKAEYSGKTTQGVTLDAQGATQRGTTSISPAYGSAMPAISLPSRSYEITYVNGASISSDKVSYAFLGYFDEKEGSGIQYYDGNGKSTHSWNKTTSTTLYGAWEESEAELQSAEKEGYTFLGWSTRQGGSVQYSAGDSIVPTKDMTLYAVWGASEYTVILDDQGATGSGSSTVAASYGSVLPSINVPVKTFSVNYENCDFSEATVSSSFCGYFTGINGYGVQYYTADGSGCRTWDRAESTTLYACWQPNPVTLPSASKTGYTFKGWSTDGGNTVSYKAGQSLYPSADVTLYPVFQGNSYSITFDTQGATKSGTLNTDAEYDQALSDIVPPERSYTATFEYVNANNVTVTEKLEAVYEFTGYYDRKNGEGTRYYDYDGEGSTSWDRTAQTTLYACWEASEVEAPEPEDERTGFTFKGWSDTPGGKVKYTPGDEIIPEQNMNLYGIWQANTYTVTLECGDYEDNDEDNSSDDDTSDIDDETDKDESDTKVVVTAGTKSVQATYGNIMPDIKVPTMTNYTFLGYYDEEDGGEMYYDAGGKAVRPWDKDDDEYLYAVWKLTNVPYYEKTYTQNASGNYDVVIVKKRAAVQSTVFKNASEIKIGDGYVLNKDKSVLSGEVKNGYTAIRVYIDRTRATLKYDLNGGSSSTITDVTSCWGAEIELTDEEPERKGYEFCGWAKTATSSNTIYDIILDKAGTTVYAVWEVDEYASDMDEDNTDTDTGNVIGEEGNEDDAITTHTIIFENRTIPVEDESTEPDISDPDIYDVTVKDTLAEEDIEFKNGTTTAYVKEGEAYPDVNVPSRTNYSFLGFYDTESTSDGEKIYDAAGKAVKAEKVKDDLTLYAVWKLEKAPYFEVVCRQTEDGDYTATANRKRAGIGTTVSVNPSDITVPSGYTFNQEKSVLSGTVSNGAVPIIIYLDRNGQQVAEDDEDQDVLPSETDTPDINAPVETEQPVETEEPGSIEYGDEIIGQEEENSVEIEFECRTFDTSEESTEPDSDLFDDNTYETQLKDTLEDEKIVFKKGTVLAYIKENDQLPAEISIPVRTNYRFLGYYDDDNTSEGEQYYDENGKAVYTGKIAENITLYAIWELSEVPYYEIMYYQRPDKSYFATATRKRAAAGSTVSVKESDIAIPAGYTLKKSKSVFSGTVKNGSAPIVLYFDRLAKKKASCLSSVKMGKGETYRLTVKGDEIKKVTLTVTGKKIVTADASASYVKLKGIAAGKTKISITTKTGTKLSCTVTIAKTPHKVQLSSKKLTLKKGRKKKIKVSFPKGEYSSALKFSSNNKKVVSVNSVGTVTAKKAGKAIITVKTFNGKACRMKVIVKK